MQDHLTDIGKIPPQELKLETAVLGSMLLEKDRLLDVIDQLTPETFYKTEHQIIFKAIKDIFQDSQVDILTITNHLRKTGELERVGGAYYISTLTNGIGSAANIQEHVLIIRQKYIQRELVRVGSELIKRGYEDTDDVFDLLEFADQSIMELHPQPQKATDLQGIAKQTIQNILTARETHTNGIPSGIPELDYFTGLVPSNLLILAARPGMGKTALALKICREVARKTPIGIFSLEMSDNELYSRMLAAETEIPLQRLLRGDMADYEFQKINDHDYILHSLPIWIDDSPSLTIFDIRTKARRWKSKHSIGLIIVDYLQLMAGKQGGNREQEISSISRGLKALAKELQIPIIALSQLSRSCESRADKRPILSDLRESGAIEQDADVVLFLYRDGMYVKGSDQEPTELIIGKNRNGKVGTTKDIRFLGTYTKFVSYTDGPRQIEIKEEVF
jgi:replicative DNA helicase